MPLCLAPDCCSSGTRVLRQATFRPMACNKVFWARHGQQIVARVKNSLKSRRLRSFEGYHDQLGADDVIPEEARNTSERACFGKVVLNERQVIIAGPNKQARLRAGKDAWRLLQQYRTDEDLAAYIDRVAKKPRTGIVSAHNLPMPMPGEASAGLGQPVHRAVWGSQCQVSQCLRKNL